MTIFDLLFVFCLGGVILSFCGSNFGLPFLSDHLRWALDYDTKVNIKVNDDPEENEATGSDRPRLDSRNPNLGSARISVIGSAAEKAPVMPDTDSVDADDDDLSQVLNRVTSQMNGVEQPQNVESAFKETVAKILSNEMLRNAFFQDLQDVNVVNAVNALRNILDDRQLSPDVEKET